MLKCLDSVQNSFLHSSLQTPVDYGKEGVGYFSLTPYNLSTIILLALAGKGKGALFIFVWCEV